MSKEFILWKTEFNTGIATIDKQHQRLVGMINELYDAFVKKEHHDKVIDIIGEMQVYTLNHFNTEELLMDRCQYADLEAHKLEHKQFAAKVAEFSDMLTQNNTTVTFKVISFLQEWLLHHIQETDQKYVLVMKKAGIN